MSALSAMTASSTTAFTSGQPARSWRTGRELAASGRDRLRFAVKRGLDVLLSSAAIIALSPLFIAIALAIKADSSGPVFFVQRRAGARRCRRGGSLSWKLTAFPMFKFRTMRAGADERVHERRIADFVNGRRQPDGTFKVKSDPRITRLGEPLRRWSLDELPQLLNVLRGEMSLVGPRPVPLYEAEYYQADQLERLCSLPGITGLWQVRGRAHCSFEEMIRLDIDYVRSQSLLLDLKLLLTTLPVVLRGRGAC